MLKFKEEDNVRLTGPPLDFLRNHIGIVQRVLPNDQYEVQFRSIGVFSEQQLELVP